MRAGSVVQLKSGGPLMTVGWFRASDQKVFCHWFDEQNALKSHIFFFSQLNLIASDDKS